MTNKENQLVVLKTRIDGQAVVLFVDTAVVAAESKKKFGCDFVMGFGLYVGESFSAARKWWKGAHGADPQITGKGSVAGLKWAKEQIEKIRKEIARQNRHGSKTMMVINGADARRARAYRYMLKSGKWRQWGRDSYPTFICIP
jgi:hypothetical protein